MHLYHTMNRELHRCICPHPQDRHSLWTPSPERDAKDPELAAFLRKVRLLPGYRYPADASCTPCKLVLMALPVVQGACPESLTPISSSAPKLLGPSTTRRSRLKTRCSWL